MRYYLDEDISPKVAEMLREYQVDAISTHEVNMIQAADIEQLAYAASTGRAMVTRNRNDFIQLTVQFFNGYRTHHGVLILPYTIAGDKFQLMADRLRKYAIKHPAGMEPYSIDFL